MTGHDGVRWVCDPGDCVAHVLADPAPAAEPGVLVTICARELPIERTPTFSVPPSLVVYRVCGPSGRIETPFYRISDTYALVSLRPVVGVTPTNRRPAGPERPPAVTDIPGGPPPPRCRPAPTRRSGRSAAGSSPGRWPTGSQESTPTTWASRRRRTGNLWSDLSATDPEPGSIPSSSQLSS